MQKLCIQNDITNKTHHEQPQVSSASVNLTTETAIIWPASEAKVAPNWQKDVGEALAKHLTSCGFKSNLRGLLFGIY